MKQHPINSDGTLIESAYTLEYVQRHFVPKADVRDKYVPKEEFDKRLKAKNDKLAETAAEVDQWKEKVLEMQPRLAESQTLAERLRAMEQQIEQGKDRDALLRAGVLQQGDDGDAQVVDPDLVRFAFDKHLKALPEDQKPEDVREAYRAWLTAEDGLRAHSSFAPLLAPSPAAAPAPSPAPATKPPPTGNTQTVQQARSPKVTPQDRQAYFKSAEFRSMPFEDQKKKWAELKQQDTRQG